MTRTTKVMLGSGAAIALACVLGFALWPNSQRQIAGQPSAPPPETLAPQANHESNPSATGNTPLPEIGRPLRLTVSELEGRAKQGDAKAACRLAAEYSHCALVNLQADYVDNVAIKQAAAAAPIGTSRAAPEISLTLPADNDAFAAGALHCDDVKIPGPAAIAELWHRAALQGHLPSMTNYSVGNAFRQGDTLENLDALMVYKRDAENIARSAAEAGDLMAMMALASAYAPESRDTYRPLLTQVVRVDIQEALTLYLQLQASLRGERSVGDPLLLYIDRKVALLEVRASGEQAASARSAAMDRATRWKRPQAPEEVPFAALERGRAPSLELKDCE